MCVFSELQHCAVIYVAVSNMSGDVNGAMSETLYCYIPHIHTHYIYSINIYIYGFIYIMSVCTRAEGKDAKAIGQIMTILGL